MTGLPEYIQDRIMQEPNSGCWIWTGPMFTTTGYGQLYLKKPIGRTDSAHRIMYEFFKGHIPKGLHLDHLCRVRSCCNPNHLEAVTPTENKRRGVSIITANMAKTHCVHGHSLTKDNIYSARNKRECRICRAIAVQKYELKKRSRS